MGDSDDEYEHVEIARAQSAFNFFSKLNSAAIKAELVAEGKDSSLGVLASVISAKFKSLPDNERAKYVKLAEDDRERYNRECELRDEEVLRLQEERRKQPAVGAEMDTRMRGSTLAVTDALTVKYEQPKKQRMISEAEKDKLDQRRSAKKEEDMIIKYQLDTLKQERMQQAEAR